MKKMYGFIVAVSVIGFIVGAVFDPAHIAVGGLVVGGCALFLIWIAATCDYISRNWQKYS